MDILLLITNILFIIVIVKRLLFSAWILHESKYRIDQLLPALRSQKYTRTQNLLTVFRLIGFILFIPVVLYDNVFTFYHLLVAIIFLCDSVFFINEIKDIRQKISLLKFKEFIIVIPTVLAILFLYSNPLIETFFWLLILERFTLFIYFFFALAFSFPLEIYEDLQIEKTKLKRKTIHHLQIIAITGDYKNHTSNFVKMIFQISNQTINISNKLSSLVEISQFMDQVIQNNTTLSVLNLYLHDKDNFIKAAELIRPNVFVSINSFNKRKIKPHVLPKEYEIADSLTRENLFICDVSGAISKTQINSFLKKIKNISAKPILYYIDQTNLDLANIFNSRIVYCSEIEHDDYRVTFKLNIQKKSYFMQIPLIYKDQLTYLIPAIIIAYYSGFSLKDISRYFFKTIPDVSLK